MAQPLYFLPHVSQAQVEAGLPIIRSILRERGLAEIFNDVPMERVCYAGLAGRGPGDLSGTVITYQTADGKAPRRLGYYAGEQSWTAVGDGSLLWIGVDTDEPAKPEELIRSLEYPGYTLTLGDGNRYMIPVVRRPDGSTNLPTDMIFDAVGKLQEPIKPAYLRYWDASAEVLEIMPSIMTGIGLENIDRTKFLKLAIQAFGLNYRYGLAEHSVLRLIDKTNFLSVLALSVDAPRVMQEQEAQKKT